LAARVQISILRHLRVIARFGEFLARERQQANKHAMARDLVLL
jgi:hypothetical protein